MTSQPASHWKGWILPIAAQYARGIPFREGQDRGINGSIPVGAFVKAWAWGAVKTMAAPSVTDAMELFHVERTHFYEIPVSSDLDRARYMMRDKFGVIYLSLMVSYVIFYVFAAAGAVRMGWVGMILVGYCLIVVALTGPVGNAKYRLPMEPVLCIMVGEAFRRKEHDGQ